VGSKGARPAWAWIRLGLMVTVATTLLAGPATLGGGNLWAQGFASSTTAGHLGATQGIGNQTGDWPSFMNGIGHSSYQPVNDGLNAGSASNLTQLWTFSAGKPVISEPTVVGHSIYFGSWNGYEYSVSATNGSLQWSSYLGQSDCRANGYPQGVTSTATVANGTVYVGGGGEYWDALSESNGTVLWEIFTGNNSTRTGGHYNWASPTIYGGYAYVGISSHCDMPLVQGQLLKVGLGSHKVTQVFNTTTPALLGATIWASPAINPATNTVFVATGNVQRGNNSTLDDSLLAINLTTFSLKDRFQVPYAVRKPDGDFGASPTLYVGANGIPMIADTNKNGYLYALDQANLSKGPVWSLKIAHEDTFSSASYSNGILYVGSSGSILPQGRNVSGALWAVNATTGAVLWTHSMPGIVYGPVATTSDLVVGAGGDQFVVINRYDGRVVYSFTAPDPFYGGASISGGRIYIGNNDGSVYAFGVPLAAHIHFDFPSKAHPKEVSFSGSATGGAHGYTFAWNFGDGTDATGAAVTHVYLHPGNYTATLTVTDRLGSTVLLSTNVVVSEPRGPRNLSLTRR